MTLVKGYNISAASEYAELLHLGHPHFLEIKAVTFCGKGDGSAQMTMENVRRLRRAPLVKIKILDCPRRIANGGGSR